MRYVIAIRYLDYVSQLQIIRNKGTLTLKFYCSTSDGTSFRVTANGLEKQPGIFISRLVPGGLAESTGLLAVNDEVLEVNGIEVAGKTLDQVNKTQIFTLISKNNLKSYIDMLGTLNLAFIVPISPK